MLLCEKKQRKQEEVERKTQEKIRPLKFLCPFFDLMIKGVEVIGFFLRPK